MKVVDKCCDHCLFSANKLVNDARRDEIVEETKANNSYFECHRITSHRWDVLYDDKWGDDHKAAASASKEVQGCCHAFYKLHATKEQQEEPVEYVPLPDIDPSEYIFFEPGNRA